MRKWLRHWLVRRIEAYQRAGGGRHYFGVACNFAPTCSEYTRQAILDRGVRGGVAAGWRRLRRCNDPDPARVMEDPYVP